MLAGLWIIAVVIFVGVWLLYWLEDGRHHGAANNYRQKYVRLIDRLETLVHFANKLDAPSRHARDVKILDTYLSHLRMLESLMTAVRTMPPFGTNTGILQAPAFLVSDIHDRFKTFESLLNAHLNGKPLKTDPAVAATQIGCYFCSRPFDPILFHKVRVKIDGSSSEVTACKTCRDRLTAGKKARVLFFDEDGRAVHWTKAKGYVASEQYWTINADTPSPTLNTGSHLTLVHSSVSPLSSLGKFE